MSGPKVVVVATIEERIYECRRLLRRLDAIVAQWIKLGEKHGIVTAEEIAATRARRDQVAGMINASSIDVAERQLPSEIGFLAEDMERRIAQALEKRAAALKADRSMRFAAASLLRDHDIAGALSASTTQALKGASASNGGGGDAIAAALREIADAAEKTQEAALKSAAARLGGGDVISFGSWLAQSGLEDPKVAQIERHIAELAVVDGSEAVEPFQHRLDGIQQGEKARKDILLDSLALELVGEVKKARRIVQLNNEIAAKREELAEMADPAALRLIARMDELKQGDDASMEDLNTETAAYLDQVLAAKAADDRRRAVLAALGQLGYEVTEGMSTSWEKKGRLVLRRQDDSGEGVEVGGAANSPMLQMRPVRIDGLGGQSGSDAEIETHWCGDFARLREGLEKAGANFRVERMVPVGAVAVKTYDVTELEGGQRASADKTQLHKLKH